MAPKWEIWEENLSDLPADFDTFMEAWNGLPRTSHALLPQKKDITPVLFGQFLPLVCVAEMVASENLQLRFVGSEFERLAGLQLSLKNYYDFLPAKFIKATKLFHDRILGTPCAAFVRDLISSKSGNRYLHETLHLPLADENGAVRYLMIYGVGRKPAGDLSFRKEGDHNESNIKELFYIDLGAGAPADHVKEFIFHRQAL